MSDGVPDRILGYAPDPVPADRRVHQGDPDLRREPEGAHQPRVSRADHNDMLIRYCVLVRDGMRTAAPDPV